MLYQAASYLFEFNKKKSSSVSLSDRTESSNISTSNLQSFQIYIDELFFNWNTFTKNNSNLKADKVNGASENEFLNKLAPARQRRALWRASKEPSWQKSGLFSLNF